jgi:hypothetical protein
MNLTLLVSLACLAAWLGLIFGAHIGSGPVHLLWAAAVLLAARRVLVGAPRFRS